MYACDGSVHGADVIQCGWKTARDVKEKVEGGTNPWNGMGAGKGALREGHGGVATGEWKASEEIARTTHSRRDILGLLSDMTECDVRGRKGAPANCNDDCAHGSREVRGSLYPVREHIQELGLGPDVDDAGKHGADWNTESQEKMIVGRRNDGRTLEGTDSEAKSEGTNTDGEKGQHLKRVILETLSNSTEESATDLDVSDEVQSVDSEELLSEQLCGRRDSETRKDLPRADSMKNLGQHLRDDLGVKVRGLRLDGTVASYEVRPETASLLLGGMRLTSVTFDTLLQLSRCSLREISLAANYLEEIDLTAISHCQNLQALLLNGCRLWRIDLLPLAKCCKLEKLWLQNNELESIDLQPLEHCPSLRSLYLENNQLGGTLDLTPLKACSQLRSLRLKSNKLAEKLDITALLSCRDLSAMTVDGYINLCAVTSMEALPPGLKKYSSTVTWLASDKRQQGKKDGKKDVKLHALLIGFRSATCKDVTKMLEKYGGFAVSVAEKTISNLSALKMFDVFVVELPFPWSILEEIRLHVSATPFVLVGKGTNFPSVDPFKADRLFAEPLSPRDAVDVRNLTRKVIDDDFVISTPLETPATIDSDALFFPMNEEQRKALEFTLSQSRMEELTVENIFRQNDGFATEVTFRHLARVCRLPVCTAGTLFEACLRDGDPVRHNASYASFSRFWGSRLAGFDPEERLYNVLTNDEENGVRVSGIEKLVSAFFQERASMFHERLALEFAVMVASACLCFALCGSSGPGRPFTLRELRRGTLSKALLGAENGRFEGVAMVLRADRVEALLGLLSTVATKDSDGGVSASLEDMRRVNIQKELLVPKAVESVFHRYANGSQRIGVAELTRFWIAVSEPGARASVEYLFPVMDTDMDGCITVGDVHCFYKEKEAMSRVEGYVIADLEDTWTYVCDMIGVIPSASHRIRLEDLKRLPESGRTHFVQTFLFKNDEMSLLDVRRTMEEVGTKVRVAL